MSKLLLVDLVGVKFGIKPMLYDIDDFVCVRDGSSEIDYYGYDKDVMGFFDSLRGAYSLGLGFQFNIGGMKVDYPKYFQLIDRAFFGYTLKRDGAYIESVEEVISRGEEISFEMKDAMEKNDMSRILDLADESAKMPRVWNYDFFKNLFGSPNVNVNYLFNEKVKNEIENFRGEITDIDSFNDYLLKVYGLEELVKK